MKLVAMNGEAAANYMNIAVRQLAAGVSSLCGLYPRSIKSFLN
jgi:hypothetical protein